MSSDPTVAKGIARADDFTCPAMTGTISKPWKVNRIISPAPSQSRLAAGHGGERRAPRRGRRRRGARARGRSFKTVSEVQTRAEMRIPEATIRARTATRPVAKARRARGPPKPRLGAVAFVRPDHHRGRAQERAHVGDPAHEERREVAEGGAGEDHGAAVLVEEAPESGEGQGHGHEGERR